MCKWLRDSEKSHSIGAQRLKSVFASSAPAEMSLHPTLTPRLSQWLPREMVVGNKGVGGNLEPLLSTNHQQASN